MGAVGNVAKVRARELRKSGVTVQFKEVGQVRLAAVVIEDALRFQELITHRIACDRLQDDILYLRAVHRRYARISQDHLAIAGVIDSLHVLTTLLEHPTDIVRGIVGQDRGREE